jgi:hypothetical protein
MLLYTSCSITSSGDTGPKVLLLFAAAAVVAAIAIAAVAVAVSVLILAKLVRCRVCTHYI